MPEYGLNSPCRTVLRNRILLWVLLGLLTCLSACDLKPAQEQVKEAAIQAKSLLTKLKASRCSMVEVRRQILQESGFYADDPVRGLQPIAGLTIALNNIREESKQADRVICLANIEIHGPRSILLRESLTTNWSPDTRFAVEEISQGFGGEDAQNNGLWSLLGNVTTVSLLAMAQAFEDDADGDKPISFSSPIEYAVFTTPNDDEPLKAWAWIPGSSPGHHAGRMMRELQNQRESPPGSIR